MARTFYTRIGDGSFLIAVWGGSRKRDENFSGWVERVGGGSIGVEKEYYNMITVIFINFMFIEELKKNK